MKKWLRNNWFKLLIIILILIITLSLFIWYGYRPYKARKDCAWIKMHADAVEFKPSSGNEDMWKACLDACLYTDDDKEIPGDDGIYDGGIMFDENCVEKNCDYLYIPQQEAIPEANWLIEPTDEEYDRCLREKGL